MDLRNCARFAWTLGKMRQNQWKGQEELELLQGDALMALLAHAKQHVPYYRRSLKDVSIRGLDGLAGIPQTAKADVQENPEMFVSDAFRRSALSRHRTSGSTGKPLTVYYSPEDAARAAAQRTHWLFENGIGPFDLQVNLTYYECPRSLPQALGMFRVSYLHAKASESANLRALCRLKPSAIVSVPLFIIPLAMANLEAGSPVAVRGVFTCGEVLPSGTRELIESSFSCHLSDRYGTIETGPVAWECERGSMHVFSDSVIVEILDDDGNPVRRGEFGNVVLTPLKKRSMPFIRYRIGDRAAWGPKCPCGRGLHVIKELQGRRNSALILPSGRAFCSTMVGVALRSLPGIISYQTVQERRDLIRITVVKGKTSGLTRAQIADAVSRVLPEPIGIEVDEAERIEPEKSGKMRDFISKISGRKPEG